MRRNITRVVGPGQLGSLVARRAALGEEPAAGTIRVPGIISPPVILSASMSPSLPAPLTAVINTQAAAAIANAPTLAPSAQPGAFDKLTRWFGEEAFTGTGISRGAVTAGSGLLLLVATMGRRR